MPLLERDPGNMGRKTAPQHMPETQPPAKDLSPCVGSYRVDEGCSAHRLLAWGPSGRLRESPGVVRGRRIVAQCCGQRAI